MMAVWNQSRQKVRVHHHNQTDQQGERNAVLGDGSKYRSFVAFLPGRRAGNYQLLDNR
jgi:hypothetical protein